MTKYLRRLILSMVTLGVLVVVPAVSASDNSGSGSSNSGSSNTTTSQSTSGDSSSGSTTETPADIAARTSRLEKEKLELKVKPDVKEIASLKVKCKPAQLVVRTIGDKVEQKVKDRSKAYGEITDRLTGLVVKLKAKGVDTTALEAEITTLNTKIALFNSDLAAYKVTISDLKAVDCATDPTAFKAALEVARTANTKVLADAADIKAYIKNTIKLTLQTIRTTLEAQEKSSSTNTQGGN